MMKAEQFTELLKELEEEMNALIKAERDASVANSRAATALDRLNDAQKNLMLRYQK